MSKFIDALVSDDQKTENGMSTHSTTGSSLLNFFPYLGSSRNLKDDDLIRLFSESFNDDDINTIKLLFYGRDVRGGLGERRMFRVCINHFFNSEMYKKYTLNSISYLLVKIPEYGRWDDLIQLYETLKENESLHYVAIDIIVYIIESNLKLNNKLCAKWLPRKGNVARMLRNDLGLSPKIYRKLLVDLNNTVEKLMSSKQWDFINFEKIPSVEMTRYKNAFKRNAKLNYENYINGVNAGIKKINMSASYPYDIIRAISDNSLSDKNTIQAMWDNLPKIDISNNIKLLPVIDVSGSMSIKVSGSVSAKDIAIGLGIYISEHNEGPFKNYMMTFSSEPHLVKLHYNYLADKYYRVRKQEDANCYNTDIEKTFDYLLSHSVKHNVPAEDMPTHLLLISDMEFDEAIVDGQSLNIMDMIRKKYKDANYELPTVIFWNVAKKIIGNYQAKSLDENVIMISGFTPSVLKNIENLKNPMCAVNDVINSERYSSLFLTLLGE